MQYAAILITEGRDGYVVTGELKHVDQHISIEDVDTIEVNGLEVEVSDGATIKADYNTEMRVVDKHTGDNRLVKINSDSDVPDPIPVERV